MINDSNEGNSPYKIQQGRRLGLTLLYFLIAGSHVSITKPEFCFDNDLAL